MFLHIEAPDEAGHQGEYELKRKAIEDIDHRVCKPIIEAVKNMNEPVAIAVLPDHPTPCKLRTHSGKPVPFIIYKPGEREEKEDKKLIKFSEDSACLGDYGILKDDEFIDEFLK